MCMKDYMARLREEAQRREQERKKAQALQSSAKPDEEQNADIDVAKYLGVSEEEVSVCCGSTCPHCDMFLDKAIALVELGSPHHLFMNPSQEEIFKEALEIYRQDRTEYAFLRQELMDRMRS